MASVLKRFRRKKKGTQPDCTNEIKIALLGSGGVGSKSAFVVQYIQHHFITEYDPTIESEYITQKEIDGKLYTLRILDTAGQEEYSVMRAEYIRSYECFIVGYSVTNRESMNDAEKMMEEVLRVKNASISEIPMILVGNKIDLEVQREISPMDGKNLASRFNVQFIEMSVKWNYNVMATMELVVAEWQSKIQKRV